MMMLKSGGLPWVEKYRPKSVEDVAHQKHVKMCMKSILDTGKMTHLLFYGPPGTGKTSVAHAFCRTIFGNDWTGRVLELNASDDRGIAVVREKIKTWARGKIVKPASIPGSDAKFEFKVIILDEADMMTYDAQAALRRVMEDMSKSTRFIIICNYLAKIITPLASRCSLHRFEPISKVSQLQKLQQVAAAENLTVSDEAFEQLHEVSGGDLRCSITVLQCTAAINSTITASGICEVAGFPPMDVVRALCVKCGQGLKEAEGAAREIIANGWDVSLIMRKMGEVIVGLETEDVTDLQKAAALRALATAQYRLITGSNEELQLIAACMEIAFAVRNAPTTAKT